MVTAEKSSGTVDAAELHGEEQDDDRHERDRGDDEVEGQRCQHAAIVQPRQKHDGQNDERLLVKSRMALHAGHRVEQEADGNGVAGLEHRIGHDEEQPDVEGHQRPDDVLGLGILSAGGGDGRCHFGIDHRHAGVEQAGDPAGDEAGDHAAFADCEVPSHVLADENDADAERPDMGRAKHAQQLQPLGLAGGGLRVYHLVPLTDMWRSAAASISPSRDDVSNSLS